MLRFQNHKLSALHLELITLQYESQFIDNYTMPKVIITIYILTILHSEELLFVH